MSFVADKDISEKQLEEYEDVFADIVNVLLFYGEQVIKPEELTFAPTFSAYRDNNKNQLRKLDRDVAKFWDKANIRIAYIGVENQTSVFKYMPLRVIGYDGTVYRNSLNKADSEGKETEIVEGDVFPVVTLVLYFGYKTHWTQPRSLKECFDIPAKIEPYVNDYRMNLFEIAWLDDDTISKFQSDFKFVAEYFSQMRKKQQWKPMPSKVKHVRELMDLFASLTDDKRFLDLIDVLEGVSNVMSASALEMIENRGYERGISLGIEQGIEKGKLEGENRLSKLISALIADGKFNDIKSVAVNPLRRNELYKFYNI